MATDEEILRIILRTQEEGNVAELTAKVRELEQNIQSLGPVTAQNAYQARYWGEQIADASKKIAEARGNLQRLGPAAADAGRAGQFLTQLGYAADDAQYGMKGLANQIQPVLQSFGALAGTPGLMGKIAGQVASIAAPLAVAAIGAYQLYTHFQQIKDAWDKTFSVTTPRPILDFLDEYTGKLKEATKVLEELQKKQNLTGPEAVQLQMAKDKVDALKEQVKQEQNLKDLKGAKSKEEKETGQAFKAAVAETGGEDAFNELSQAIQEKNKLSKKEADKSAKELFSNAAEGSKFSVDTISAYLDKGSAFKRNIAKEDPENKEKLAEDLEEIKRKEKELYDWDKQQEKEKVEALEADKKQFEKNLIEEQQQAKEIGHDIVAGKGQVGNAAVTGTLTEEDVKKFLEGIGSSADALMVLTAAQEEAARVVTKTAAHEGTDRDTAAKKLVADRNQQEADQAKSKLDKGVRTAKEALPGVEDLIQEGLKSGLSQGAIFDSLKGKFGNQVAGQLVREGGGKVSEENLDKFLNPKEKEAPRQSEIVGAAEFANSIQGGVSNEQNKKLEEQVQKLGAIQQILAEMKNNGGVIFKK